MTCILGACVAAVGLHLGSLHLDPEPWLQQRGMNGINPGAMVEMDNGLTLGGYRNTLNGKSLYAGYTAHFGPLAVLAGAVSYENRWYAALAPGAQFNITPHWDARIVYIPKIEATGAHVLHLMAVRRF
jgi:hypothetical protein